MQAESNTAVAANPAAQSRAHAQRARRNFWQIFGVPILLAVISAIGLIAALVGDGFYDAISWIALSIPVIVIWKYTR